MISKVTPHAGVWIETQSLIINSSKKDVTPHAGVWIETRCVTTRGQAGRVTPHAGVWIETGILEVFLFRIVSLPTRECGLKLAL